MFWTDLNGYGRSWDIWRDMDRLQRAFSDISAPTNEFPLMNAWMNGDEAVVTVELPGVDPKDIDIAVAGKNMTLRGSRKPLDAGKDETYHRKERWFGSFSRTLDLPFLVDAGKVQANFSRGVLHITLPRAEADKPKKIVIQSA